MTNERVIQILSQERAELLNEKSPDWEHITALEVAIDMVECVWHNLKEDPNDLPTKTGWYVGKVASSHDLRMVYGHENVTSDNFDAWIEVRCPF